MAQQPSLAPLTAQPPALPPEGPWTRLLTARRTWLGFSVLSLITAGAARAQTNGMGGGMGGRGHRKPDATSGAAAGDAGKCATAPQGAPPSVIMVQGYVNERLDKLPRELGLNADTAPAFERYALALHRLLDDEVSRSLKAPQAGIEVVHAIDQQIADASDRMSAWEEVQQAAKTLIGKLDTEQRAVADKRLVVSIEPKNWMGAATL